MRERRSRSCVIGGRKNGTCTDLHIGKPYAVALNEDLPQTIATFRYYGAWADKVHGQTISMATKLAYTLRQPIGVVAQIIPWNYPLSIAAW